jgi:hypothetical protein
MNAGLKLNYEVANFESVQPWAALGISVQRTRHSET